ncbi:MAG: DUF5106 domain-containing protein [Bacteroidales bacterium]|nr:DUF5106 domain-containing protein [Bacteroidales bacterium]
MKVSVPILLLLLVTACGSPKAKAPATRPFPTVEIPMMITDPAERKVWVTEHLWDRFTATDRLYTCDSLTVNGVKLEDVEKQMGVFATLAGELPLADGTRAVTRLYSRLEAFQRAYPASNMLPQLTAITTQYFYDPNSPVRNEELYLPFVSRLATSELIDPDYRSGYAWDTRMCSLNRIGTPAADFTFIDTAGKRRTLYSIKAEKILLVFGNPDCTACKELTETLDSVPELDALINEGSLKVVDIYIDQEIELWKQRVASYPPRWINGYDPSYIIRGDLIYSIRAIPSIYLLDARKRVLLKDATPERAIEALLSN